MSIGVGAFKGCNSIEEITLPFVGRTATETEGGFAVFGHIFGYTTNSTSGTVYQTTYYNRYYYYYIPQTIRKVTITVQTAIPEYAFRNCDFIESITIPETVTSIGNDAFQNCKALATLNSEIEGVFDIPASVKQISQNTFENCFMLEKVTIPATVTSIGNYAFNSCTQLAEINLADGSMLETIGNNAFSGCVMVPEITIPATVTSIGEYAFQNLSLITKVVVPDSVMSIGVGAFKGCNSIEEITLPFVGRTATETEGGFAVFGHIFGYTTNSTSGTVYQGTYYYGYCYYYIPQTIRKVTITVQTAIPANAFTNCDFIEHITIPKTVTSIGEYAFQNCKALATLNSDETGVFNLPELITNIPKSAFESCIMMESVTIPAMVTSIGNNAFSGCVMVTEITIPETVTSIGEYAFQNLSLITKVVVPDSVMSIGVGAFKGCNSIEEITLPFVGRTATETEGGFAVFGHIFGYTTNSTSGTVYQTTYYNRYYYYYIPQTIRKVTITVQTAIPEYAFRNCDFIESITIPETVTSIGNDAFQNCKATVSQTYVPTLSYWNGTDVSSSLKGKGTQSSPYQINNAADFAYFANAVNAGTNYDGKYIVLNINLSLNGKNWTPIGTKTNPFAGNFNGNNKKISGLSVTGNTVYAGLFGYVTGTVKNLGIASGTISATASSGITYAGPLVAYLKGSVENCYSWATVSAGATDFIYAGGLVGYIDNTGSVTNSYASGTVNVSSSNGFAYAGGLAALNKGTIQNTLAFGNVTAKGSSSTSSRNGGFVASNDGTTTNCYRCETQVLTNYTTVGSASCVEGISNSFDELINYAKTNWDSDIWSFELRYPTHK